jgi:hypothetical protein
MKKVLWTLAAAALGGLACLALWPVPIEPVAWKPAPSPGYGGMHEPNKLLASLQAIALGSEEGPEHVVLRDGRLYVAVASGKILRMAPDGRAQEEFARTGGRVMAFDDSGRIVAVLQDPSGAYPETTGVTETEERLYVQSLHAKALGWRPR